MHTHSYTADTPLEQFRHQQPGFEVQRRAFRASPAFVGRLDAEFLVIEKRIRWALPLLQAIRPAREASMTRDGLGIVVSACGHGLTLQWHRPVNTLRSACLFVTVWNRPVVSFELASGQARKLFEEAFSYDSADSGQAIFLAADRYSANTSADLAAVSLQYLIDCSRSRPLRWLRRWRRNGRTRT